MSTVDTVSLGLSPSVLVNNFVVDYPKLLISNLLLTQSSDTVLLNDAESSASDNFKQEAT